MKTDQDLIDAVNERETILKECEALKERLDSYQVIIQRPELYDTKYILEARDELHQINEQFEELHKRATWLMLNKEPFQPMTEHDLVVELAFREIMRDQ